MKPIEREGCTVPDDTPSSRTPIPTVAIAGRKWPVPQLSPKQNRIVVPALLELLPKIIRARERSGDPGGGMAQLSQYLDTAAYDRLADIAFHALTRAHPDLRREDFDDMPVDTAELFGALSVIALQAGLLKPAQ